MYIIIQFRTTSSIRLFGSKEKMLMASCLKPFQFMLRLLYIWNTNKFYLANQNQLCRQLLCFNNRLAQIYILCVGQRSKKPYLSSSTFLYGSHMRVPLEDWPLFPQDRTMRNDWGKINCNLLFLYYLISMKV